jgi:hypothetical protein
MVGDPPTGPDLGRPAVADGPPPDGAAGRAGAPDDPADLLPEPVCGPPSSSSATATTASAPTSDAAANTAGRGPRRRALGRADGDADADMRGLTRGPESRS